MSPALLGLIEEASDQIKIGVAKIVQAVFLFLLIIVLRYHTINMFQEIHTISVTFSILENVYFLGEKRIIPTVTKKTATSKE